MFVAQIRMLLCEVLMCCFDILWLLVRCTVFNTVFQRDTCLFKCLNSHFNLTETFFFYFFKMKLCPRFDTRQCERTAI